MLWRTLVIGSSSGLGAALLSELKSRGIISFGHSRSDSEGYELLGDASSERFSEDLCKFVLSKNINLVFFCVGSYLSGPSKDVSTEEVTRAFQDNFLSGVHTISALSNAWTKQSRGKLVLVNSVAALEPTQNESVYGAMKAALSYFAKSARLERIASGLQIMEVFPGAIKTRMTRDRENWSHLMEPIVVAQALVESALEPKLHVNSIEIRNISE